jgi:hypothetical protein
VRRRWLDLIQSDFSRPFIEGITVHRQLAEWGQIDLAKEAHGGPGIVLAGPPGP